MPQVPYQPYPTVQPRVSGEEFRVQAPAAAFGVNIGAALSHLGASIDQVGGEVFHRAVAIQELQNETDARNADAEYTKRQDEMLVGIRSLEGKQASDALSQFGENSDALRRQIRASLPNADAQRRYDSTSIGVMNRNIFSAAVHASTQLKDYSVNEAVGYADLQSKAWTDPTNQKELDQKIANTKSALGTVAGARGWGPDKQAAEEFKAASKIYAGQVNELGQRGMVEDGFSRLEELQKKGLVTQEDADIALAHLQQRNLAQGTKHVVDGVMAEGKEKNWGPEKMIQEIEERSPKFARNDARFLPDAIHYFRSREITDKAIVKEADQKNLTDIHTGIVRNEVNSLSEVQNHPTLGPAFAALSEEQKNNIPKKIAQWKLTRDMETRERTLNELDGMRQHDKDRFLEINFLDPSLPLSRSDRERGIAQQAALVKAPWDDPHVRQAKNWLNRNFNRQMRDAGVYFAPPKGAENPDYDALMGQLEQTINAWKDTHNGQAPDEVTFKTKIAPELMKTHTESGVLNWMSFGLIPTTNQVEEFRRTIEPAAIEKLRKEMVDEARALGEDVTPGDDEIRRRLVHDQWVEFYKKKGLTSGGPRGTGISE